MEKIGYVELLILKRLLESKKMFLQQLIAQLEIEPSRIYYCLRKLSESGLVELTTGGLFNRGIVSLIDDSRAVGLLQPLQFSERAEPIDSIDEVELFDSILDELMELIDGTELERDRQNVDRCASRIAEMIHKKLGKIKK